MRSVSTYHKYRKWQKVVQPLEKYNRDSCDIGYPLDFFFQLEHKISAGHTLMLNIATTLTGSKDNCIKTVFQGNQLVGRVVFTPSILKSSFDAEIEKEMHERLTKFSQRDAQFQTFYDSLKTTSTLDQLFPLAVLKEKEYGGQCNVLTLNRDQFKKMVNLESHQVAQCFVFGNGKQTSIIRFFYYPSKQNSEAFKVDNLEGFMKRKFCKAQFKIREQLQHSLTFVKIMYTNKSFYNQCLNLVGFLEKHKRVKINKIVTDWILDPHNRYYLIDVKQVSYSSVQEIKRPSRCLSDSFSFLTCAVCQQKFKQSQLNRVLTAKLINQFFSHLQKRQITLSFSNTSKPTVDTSKVCELCYMLVVSQSELIELEKKLAKVTHSITESAPSNSHAFTYSKGMLFQWRLFLYLEDIRDLNIDNIQVEATYYIMIRIHNSITSFKIKKPLEKYHVIKGIKIHYLFSQKQKIDEFLTSSEIVIRITKGNNWNSVVGEGSTSGLYEQTEKHSMRKFKQILVFNQKSQYSVVGIHIGIKMEGKYDPSDLELHKKHNVYMVEDNYSNCYALPAEWMETIDPSYCILNTETTSFNHSLHLGRSQKKQLLPSLISKNKRKLVL